MNKILLDERTVSDIIAIEGSKSFSEVRDMLLGTKSYFLTNKILKKGYKFNSEFWYFDKYMDTGNIIRSLFELQASESGLYNFLGLLSEKNTIISNLLYGDLDGRLDPETLDYRLERSIYLTNLRIVSPSLVSSLIYMLENTFSISQTKKFYQICCIEYQNKSSFFLKDIFVEPIGKGFFREFLKHRISATKSEGFKEKFNSCMSYPFDILDANIMINEKIIDFNLPEGFGSLSGKDKQIVTKVIKGAFNNEYSFVHPFGQ
tara:strand:+ start:483 stop:1265 length:783 start_codon:yes stop_codon:yes gene_type:complete